MIRKRPQEGFWDSGKRSISLPGWQLHGCLFALYAFLYMCIIFHNNIKKKWNQTKLCTKDAWLRISDRVGTADKLTSPCLVWYSQEVCMGCGRRKGILRKMWTPTPGISARRKQRGGETGLHVAKHLLILVSWK